MISKVYFRKNSCTQIQKFWISPFDAMLVGRLKRKNLFGSLCPSWTNSGKRLVKQILSEVDPPLWSREQLADPDSPLSVYTHTHPFNSPFSGTTRVSRYKKGETNLDFTEARDSEWQWYQLGHMQVCTSLQTDNHASTPPLSFFTSRVPFLPPNQQHQSTEGNPLRVYYICFI